MNRNWVRQLMLVVTAVGWGLLISTNYSYAVDISEQNAELEQEIEKISRENEQKRNALRQGEKELEQASLVIKKLESAVAEQREQMQQARAEFLEGCKRRIVPKRCDDLVRSMTDKMLNQGPEAGPDDTLPESLVQLSMLYHDHYVADEQDEMMAFYDFPIEYYEHGFQNRPFVENEWKKYFEKWSHRYSTIQSIEPDSGSAASGDVKVRIKYFFTWWDDSGRSVAGNRVSFITWKKIGRKWKIKGLNEKKWEPDEDE